MLVVPCKYTLLFKRKKTFSVSLKTSTLAKMAILHRKIRPANITQEIRMANTC
jgi:hypothetical protein